MIELYPAKATEKKATRTLTLPFDIRKKCRLRAVLDDGEEVAVFTERGSILRHGMKLEEKDGAIVEVRAAFEKVSNAHTTESLLLTRAAYHLGNRHIPLQVGNGWLRYQHDHVLDEMVLQLGLEVQVENAPFEPESGAYSGGHHHNH